MWSDWPLPRMLLGALIIAVVLALGVAGVTSAAAFGTFNTDWDGTSEVRSAAEQAGTTTTIARNVSAYRTFPANETLAVVFSPNDAYGQEVSRVRSFVRSGGTLLIAEDYGDGGNELLAAVGATARVDGRPLRDEQRAGPSPAFPKASANSTHPTTAGVDTLILNHGTVVEPGNATPLAVSSSFSYLDNNRNEALDDAETLTSRPVLTIERVGEGTVIVISDPSMFLNSMLDRGDNGVFLNNLVEGHGHVLLDVSHTTAVPPLVGLQLSLQHSPLGIILVGVLTLVVVLVVASGRAFLPRIWGQNPQTLAEVTLSQDDVLATLRQRHPEWDEERIRRVTDSLIQTDTNDQTDD